MHADLKQIAMSVRTVARDAAKAAARVEKEHAKTGLTIPRADFRMVAVAKKLDALLQSVNAIIEDEKLSKTMERKRKVYSRKKRNGGKPGRPPGTSTKAKKAPAAATPKGKAGKPAGEARKAPRRAIAKVITHAPAPVAADPLEDDEV